MTRARGRAPDEREAVGDAIVAVLGPRQPSCQVWTIENGIRATPGSASTGTAPMYSAHRRRRIPGRPGSDSDHEQRRDHDDASSCSGVRGGVEIVLGAGAAREGQGDERSSASGRQHLKIRNEVREAVLPSVESSETSTTSPGVEDAHREAMGGRGRFARSARAPCGHASRIAPRPSPGPRDRQGDRDCDLHAENGSSPPRRGQYGNSVKRPKHSETQAAARRFEGLTQSEP